MRGERLRPAAARAWPVHLALAAVAGIRRDLPRGVRRDGWARLARPPAAGLVRHRRLQLRGDGPRDVQSALQPLVSRGMPGPGALAGQAPPLEPDGPLRACRIGYCSLWARGTSVFCYGHDTRWKNNGRPDIDEFTASCENPGPGQEHVDLRRLPAGLRLEMQYVLQCRSDEQDAKLPPREIHPFVAVLAGAGASTLLEQPEEWWIRPLSAEEGARLAPVHPRRAPPRRGARVRRRLGHRVPAGHLAAAQPGHRQARGHLQLRGDPPGLAAGAGQEIHPLAAGHRPVRRHGRSGVRAVTRFAAWLAACPTRPPGWPA